MYIRDPILNDMNNNKRIKLSPQGPEMSRIVAGVWKWGVWGHQLQPEQILELINGCLEHSVTTFDHADIYGGYTDEAAFGKAIALDPSVRDKMELVTKCSIRMVSENRPEHRIKSYDTSRKHITQSVENSLRDLNTDRIDLLLIHRPDPLMDPDEVAETIEELKTQGKVLHFGVSNFTPSQFAMLNSRTHLCTNQVQISLIYLDSLFDGTLDQSIEHSAKPMAWSPLGSGKLFGEPEDDQTARVQKVAEKVAKKYGMKLDQVLLSWLMKHPAQILPVLGTAKIDRVADAVATLEVDLDREDWFELLEASTGHEVA